MIGVEWKRGTVVQPCNKECFERVVNSLEVSRLIDKIRQLQKEMDQCTKGSPMYKEKENLKKKEKVRLPGFVFMARDFDDHEWVTAKGVSKGVGKWRHQEQVRINGLFLIDVDHINNPRETFDDITKKFSLEELGIVCAFVTPSGDGLKIVAKADVEKGNIADNQKWLSTKLELPLDEACIDATRLSFACKASDVLYLSDELFSYENKEFIEKYEVQYRGGHTEATLDFAADEHGLIRTKNNLAADEHGRIRTKDNLAADEHGLIRTKDGQEKNKVCESPCKSDANNSPSQSVESDAKVYSDSYEGIKYAHIIKEWESIYRQTHKDVKRHFMVLGLSRDLRYFGVTEFDHVKQLLEGVSWYQDLMKEGRNEDSTIRDGLKAKIQPSMPASLKPIMKNAKRAAKAAGELPLAKKINDILPLDDWGQDIEKMMDYYPCMREVCFGMQRDQYPAAIFCAAALYGTLMTRTWYHFYHNPLQERRLNYAVYIIGDPTGGKSFANRLYKIIADPMIKTDAVGNEAINKYKKERNERATSTKEQKKEALKAPQPIIRCHGARTANGVFIEDMVNAVDTVEGKRMNLHLFTFDSELDSATVASKGGQWIDKSVFELKAFHNEEDNQQYKNCEAVSGPFDVFWNFIYTGTPLSLARKVNPRNFGSGLSTRLACIPLPSDSYTMIEYGTVTPVWQKVDAELNSWAYQLDGVAGRLPIEKIVKATYEWCQQKMEQARINDDKVTALLAKRVPYYGINISVPFILMRHWESWQKTHTLPIDAKDLALCKLVMNIQYECQNYFFGKFARDYFDQIDNAIANPYREDIAKDISILRSLNDEFTFEDVPKALAKMNINFNSRSFVYGIIKRWVDGNLVKQVGNKKSGKWTKI